MSLTGLLVSSLPEPPDVDEVIDTDGLTGSDWLRAGGIFVGSIVVAVIVSRVVRAVMRRSVANEFAVIITARLCAYTVFAVGLVYSMSSLGVRVGPLLGALGITTLVLALALQSVAENFVGGLILQARRPFTIGDTVELDDHVGVVTDIDSRTTVMRGLDGTMIRIPNADVLKNPIVTLTRERLRRSELVVGVAYDSNLERATEALLEAVGRVERIVDVPEPMVLLTRFGESTIDITIYYWHRSEVPAELAATHDLMLAVHQALAAAGITIAFPQMVVWPGHDADADPYGRTPGSVYSEQPHAPPPAPEPATRQTVERRRRRFSRR